MPVRRALLVLLLTAVVPRAGQAQALTLTEALRRAEANAYGNRITAGKTRAAAARAGTTLRGLLPTVRIEGGYLRTTEPLGAFGATLRRRDVTVAAFDPARLNDPPSITSVSSALVVEQPVLAMDAWFGRRAARRLADAAGATERWSRAGTQLDVIRAYYAAVLGAEQVTTLDSAARAAHAHERQAESQHRNGTATKSDALLAAVRAGEVDTRRVAALGAARLARRRLALALGSVDDTAFVLPTQLPDATKLIALAGEPATAAPGERADIRAASFVVEATKAEHRRATALLLPRLDAFGRLDWTTDGAPFGGQEAWTVGVMLRWSPFSGGAELAQRREAYAQSAAAAATLEAVEAQGRLELEEAATALETALARMAISERAVGQSAEAHRIVSRKYDGGLATAVELFDAAAEETSARLGFADARYEVITSLAQRRRAAGLDAGTITELDESER